MKLLLILLFFGMMTSCKTKSKVDLIVYNAKIYTVDSVFSIHSAFAVDKGKFLALGSDSEILDQYSSRDLTDLKGQFVFPGFYDAHCHFYGYGVNILKRANLIGSKSPMEIIERLEAHRAISTSGWLEGRGWDQNDWDNKAFPDKGILDKFFPDIPVYLIRIDGHAAWVNSKALELAAISKTSTVEGGEILLMNGEPQGILIDKAMNLVSELIPPDDKSFDEKALQLAEKNCFAAGITSVADAGLSKEIILLIDSLQEAGNLKMRIYAMLDPSEENMEYFLPKGPIVKERLSVRSIKLYADGALGSRGAKLLQPYNDDSGSGLILHSTDYYKTYCRLAYDHHFQVNTHAIGDSANRLILSIYSDFLKEKNDRRWRIEHAQIIHPDDFTLFKQYSIIPSVQPTHATSDMYWAENRIGKQRMQGAYAFHDLLIQNGWIPLGTDFPIEDINPIHTFYAAVARKDLNSYPEHGFQMENAIGREDALRGMTIWAAKSGFEEHLKGSIEKGKLADFVVLDTDLMKAKTEMIPNTQVLSTFISGEQVFHAKKYE